VVGAPCSVLGAQCGGAGCLVAAVLSARCWVLSAAVLGAALVGAQGGAVLLAQAQPPVFRARTDLVQLDVVVVDAEGRAVHGLTAADFQIFDKGRPQRIATVEEFSHNRGASPFPPTVRMDVADNTSAADRLVVLIMDDLHFQRKTEETKAMARRVVEEIGDGAALALVTTSGQFGMEPTLDRAQVISEIERFVDKYDPEGLKTQGGYVRIDPGPLKNAMGQPVPVRGPKDLASFFGDVTGLRTLEQIAKKIASDPRPRKSFVWISGGMLNARSTAGCDGGLGSESVFCSLLSGLLESLRKANVTAYPIATGDFSPGLLRDVAADSGGFVLQAGDFDRDLHRLVDDLDHYYLLGFYPEPEGEKGFHKLDVRVTRPTAIVRHRAGYEVGNAKRKGSNSELARLSEGALPIGGLPMRIHAAAAPGSGRAKARTLIAIEIDAAAAGMRTEAGDLEDTLRYEVWAVDLAKKKVVSSVARQARVALSPTASDHVSYQVHTMLTLKPGRYQLRASAASEKLEKGGSVFYELVVPDYATSEMEIGPVSVGYAAGQRVPVIKGELGNALFPMPVTLDRVFWADDKLRIVCDVIRRGNAAPRISVDLLNADGTEARPVLANSLGGDGVDVVVDLAGLAPGGYRVRIRALASSASAERELPFVVMPVRSASAASDYTLPASAPALASKASEVSACSFERSSGRPSSSRSRSPSRRNKRPSS
jgi:VWFA-related protein